ncbi:miniconductance mechanosensitive channel, partial [Aliarcobacter butzleri]
MKKYLIEFLKDIGIEPTFITVSFIFIGIIVLTAIVVHIILHKIILKSIKRVDRKRHNFITQSLLEYNLFQRLALV